MSYKLLLKREKKSGKKSELIKTTNLYLKEIPFLMSERKMI